MSGFKRDSFHVLFNLDEYRFSLQGLKMLAIAFVVLHFLAAFLAPAIYKLILAWNAGSPNSLALYLLAQPFPDYYDQARILLLLLAVPLFLVRCRLLSLRKLGFRGDFPWYYNFLRFYMIGLVWTVAVLTILISVDAVSIRSSLGFGALLGGLILAFLAAFIIGFLEELIFRSLVFRMFYTALTPMVSVVLSSLFFAYLHVKQPVALWNYETPPSDVTWLDGLPIGFWAITGMVANFNLVVFLNFALAAYVMTVVFMKSRSLWAVVGLHAGWVTPIILFANIATHDLDKPSLWWGSYRLADGFFATVCLFFIAFYFTRFYSPKMRTGFTF